MIVRRMGIEIDLSYEHKQQCPRCAKNGRDRSGDNFAIYEGGSGHCFSCGYTIPSQDYLQESRGVSNGEEESDKIEAIANMSRDFNSEVRGQIKASTGMSPKGYRGINDEVSQMYRVRYQYSQEDGSVTESMYPCTKNYGIAGYKVRGHPKNFASPGPMGETGKACDLFGQHLFKTHSNFCVIVGGEVDAMSAYQMLNKPGNKYQDIAVVSSTIGEGGVHKQAVKQYDWLNQFKRVYVCMDNDEAGQEASEKLAQSLPRGKVYMLKMRRKDPNEYLTKGAGTEFVQDFWASKLYTPAGIHASTSLYDKAMDYSDLKQLSLPTFLKTAQLMFDGGLVKNELSVVFAESSIGKSIVSDSMCVNWILNEPDEVVGVLSLESTADKWATNIISNFLDVKLTKLKGQDRKDYLNRPDVRSKVEPFLAKEDGSPRFYCFDERGAEVSVVKEKIVELIVQMGITILVVDVLSDLADGLALNEQEDLTSWFKKLIKEYSQLSVLMVCHTRKRPSGGRGQLTESDIMGTSTVYKSAAQTISLERDKQADNPILRNCTFVRVHKNRHFSQTGPAGVIYYDPETGKLWDIDDYVEAFPEKSQEILEALGQSED